MNLSTVLDAFYPPACAGCRTPGTPFCRACSPRGADVVRCERAGLSIVASGAYAGPLRRAILALKRGRRDLAAPLGALLAEAFAREGVPHSAIVVPVPTTHGSVAARGFDQGIALARELAIGDVRPVLIALRKRTGVNQRGRSRSDRLSAAGRFEAVRPILVGGAEAVLVDDVVTTGATLADCAATLRANGATVRRAFVLACA